MVKRTASSWLLLFCSLFIATLVLFLVFKVLQLLFFLVLLAGLTPVIYLGLKAFLAAGSSYGRPAKLKSRN
jgi:hypothetical protein